MFWKKIKVVTHDSRFHADDVFAVATLDLVFNGKIKVIRTRDEDLIKKGDIVLDVGLIYDAEKNRFDHHQKEGAGIRENGIPYASFGLIWKHFGRRLCSDRAWEIIEKKIVQSIDAGDNGVSTFNVNELKVFPYLAQTMLFSFMPSWKENIKMEDAFDDAVQFVKKVLKREIIRAEHSIEIEKFVLDAYEKSEDKKIVVIPKEFQFSDDDVGRILFEKSDVYFSVRYRPENDQWTVKGVRVDPDELPMRKYFPKEWGGLVNEELQKVSGVSDAMFCHRGVFLATARSLEGAILLAKKALSQ